MILDEKPSQTKKNTKKLVNHGDERIDNYYWLRDDKRRNKSILNYLKQENKYTDQWFKENKVNSKKIFERYKESLPKSEKSVETSIDGVSYYFQSSISTEYNKYYQIKNKRKKLILDVNKLAKNKKYYEISSVFPSRNHKHLAY